MSKTYKKHKIKQNYERVLLSDVLPYETPVFFSNRYFYRIVKQYSIKMRCAINWNTAPQNLQTQLRKIFNLHQKISIPFIFKIRHSSNDYRVLSICHPLHQLEMSEFYKDYADLILYYTNQSPFSIRKPNKVSKYIYYEDVIHEKHRSTGNEKFELIGKEYEQIKSFFSYSKYSNVYKFYESKQFHQCEKKYDYLLKLDISKCFDSVYTHSISWAVLGKEITKLQMDASKEFFAGKFDALMQRLNYNETNGIIIGPEFSRIFCEIILQNIDVSLKNKLSEQGLTFKVDYEIYRYVDDYFIFFNDQKHSEIVKSELAEKLRLYKLHLNLTKERLFSKPIITEQTIARNKIANFFKEVIHIDEHWDKSDSKVEMDALTLRVKPFKANNVITKFKAIIQESGVGYPDVLNYSLVSINKRLQYIADRFEKIAFQKNVDLFKNIQELLVGVVEFCFFIFSVEPRVTFSIKLAGLIMQVLQLIRTPKFTRVQRDTVYKSIYDNINSVLIKFKNHKYNELETVYLFQIMNELGKSYKASSSTLEEYFGITDIENSHHATNLNYFAITGLFLYIGNDNQYSSLHQKLLNIIEQKFKGSHRKGVEKLADTELFLFFTDILSCPFIEADYKKSIMKKCGIDEYRDDLINFYSNESLCFTNWRMSNFARELDRKKGREVY